MLLVTALVIRSRPDKRRAMPTPSALALQLHRSDHGYQTSKAITAGKHGRHAANQYMIVLALGSSRVQHVSLPFELNPATLSDRAGLRDLAIMDPGRLPSG